MYGGKSSSGKGSSRLQNRNGGEVEEDVIELPQSVSLKLQRDRSLVVALQHDLRLFADKFHVHAELKALSRVVIAPNTRRQAVEGDARAELESLLDFYFPARSEKSCMICAGDGCYHCSRCDGCSKCRADLVPCKYFLEGRCWRGASCSFSHGDGGVRAESSSASALQRIDTSAGRAPAGKGACSFFLEGRCTRGFLCPFSHGDGDGRKDIANDASLPPGLNSEEYEVDEFDDDLLQLEGALGADDGHDCDPDLEVIEDNETYCDDDLNEEMWADYDRHFKKSVSSTADKASEYYQSDPWTLESNRSDMTAIADDEFSHGRQVWTQQEFESRRAHSASRHCGASSVSAEGQQAQHPGTIRRVTRW